MIRVTKRYPLDALAASLGIDKQSLSRRLNVSGSTWKEYRDLGVSAKVADRLAVRMGLHPFEVWPEMVDDAVAEAEAEMRAAAAARRRRWAKTPKGQASQAAATKKWREAVGEYYLAQNRQTAARWRANNPERKRMSDAAYYERNKEQAKAKRRAYYAANREKELARQRAYDARKRAERAA